MNRRELFKEIQGKKSFLCVGLDTDIDKIPAHLLDLEDPIFEFNKQIIDRTKDFAIAYKPNIAFYECLGPKGWDSLKKTIDYIPENCFVIADAKRGDIGNTSLYYAKTYFDHLDCDAVTVAPYMGSDSVTPFIQRDGKWVILLALTSNEGALNFQFIRSQVSGKYLFEEVLDRSKTWGNEDNLMYVVGATRAEMFVDIRKHVPDHFLLVPGLGAQGGDLASVAKYGMNETCGLIVNASRSILYASNGNDFAEAARLEAQKIQLEMESLLREKGLVS
jgi:orotidine-5'-phosphate decarboxylase